MPISSPPSERPAPQYWGLDPLFHAHVALLAAQINALSEDPTDKSVLWLGNHPVQRCEVVGIVVELRQNYADDGGASRLSFQLDDGSGLINCVHWWHTDSNEQRKREAMLVRLGAVVRVLGRFSKFRDERQVTVEQWSAERDVYAESVHWARAKALWHDCYSRPFRIPNHAIEAEQQQNAAAAAAASGANAPAAAPPPAALSAAVRDILTNKAGDVGLTVREMIDKLPPSIPIQGHIKTLTEEIGRVLEQLELASIAYVAGSKFQDDLWKAV